MIYEAALSSTSDLTSLPILKGIEGGNVSGRLSLRNLLESLLPP
jgi:hypothetical protein